MNGSRRSINYLHELREQSRGQRVVRFYGPDLHIIEVGEPMESVARRLLANGPSVEEAATRTAIPVESLRQLAYPGENPA